MLLAFDTSMAACSAAVYDMDRARLGAARFLRMERGHADVLAPMIKEVMNEAGLAFSDLARIAVTLGPGSFTGVRTGIAMARGLAMALDRPVAGIDTLSAIAANAESGRRPLVIAADARRGEVYFAVVGSPASPVVLPVGEAVNRLPEGSSFILGTGSEALITAAPPNRLVRLKSGDLPDARSFAARCAALPLSDTPPEPLYLRPPDAKPQARPMASLSQPAIRQASAEEASLLAALHAECFDNAWTAAEFARLMAMPGAAAYLACEGDEPLAFLLARQAAGEGEILTIGTRPFARRRGIAGRLVSHLAEAMRKTKVSQLFIEVATDNAPGRALYASEGFTVTGRRKAYYEKPGGERQDAVVMMKTLVCPQGAAR